MIDSLKMAVGRLVVSALLSTSAFAQTGPPAVSSRSVAAANATLLQNPDLSSAEQLVREGKYQEAYDLLAPLEATRSSDPDFTYWFGRAALGAGMEDKAQRLFERSLENRPDWVDAHLALGRAYYEQGDYGAAKIEFETVLRFDDVPPDLLTQVEIYNKASQRYLDQGKNLVGFAYLVGGIGRYWEHPNASTDEEEDALKRRDTFYNARTGFGLNYELPGNYALDANLDYRFRNYNNHEIRNDSDWRWFGELSRTIGESNLALGLQGRVSYRGNGQYRNDYGLLGSWRYRASDVNQFNFSAEVRRRAYPRGPLHDRSRNIGTGTAQWTRSFSEGRSSFSIGGDGGYEWATSRPQGNSSFFGLNTTLNLLLARSVDLFVTPTWEHHLFSDETLIDNSTAERIGVFSRTNNTFSLSGGLVWLFHPGWSLRPEVFWERVTSNFAANEFHATEAWINLRKDF